MIFYSHFMKIPKKENLKTFFFLDMEFLWFNNLIHSWDGLKKNFFFFFFLFQKFLYNLMLILSTTTTKKKKNIVNIKKRSFDKWYKINEYKILR